MFFRDRQVVDFQGAHVRLDGFLDVGQRGILRFALGDAAGQAGALGDPETIFAAIDENLSHTFIMSDSESVRETCPGLAGLGIVCGSRASPCINHGTPVQVVSVCRAVLYSRIGLVSSAPDSRVANPPVLSSPV